MTTQRGNEMTANKPTRHALAVALRRNDGLVLAVRRPDEPGEELPNIWGLPAVTLLENETAEETIQRLGAQKLGIELTPLRQLAEGEQQRKDYTLHMTVYEASADGEPMLPRRTPDSEVTLYAALDWLPIDAFNEAAERGSLCCKLYLETLTPYPSPRGRGEVDIESRPALGSVRKMAVRRLRRESTQSEDLLWERLRDRGLDGFKFRRQHPIGPFVVGFYCTEKKLVVEVDGPIHKKQVQQDRERQQWLEESGDVQVIRVLASDVEANMHEVLAKIHGAL